MKLFRIIEIERLQTEIKLLRMGGSNLQRSAGNQDKLKEGWSGG